MNIELYNETSINKDNLIILVMSHEKYIDRLKLEYAGNIIF